VFLSLLYFLASLSYISSF